MLAQSELKYRLHYDPQTGVFTWVNPSPKKSKGGAIAGTKHDRGYLMIGINGERHLSHRLAWLYMTGEWPTQQIDHRNGVRDDNRWENLRAATQAINSQNLQTAQRNSTTGFLGVFPWGSSGKRYLARICVDRKYYKLGVFDDPEEAHAAYLSAKRKLHEGCVI